MEAKKHRRKIKRTVMIVSNDINKTYKQHNLSTVVALFIVFIMVACASVALFCFYIDEVSLASASKSKSKLESQIADLKATNRELEKKNEELSEKNSILGVTLDEKIKEEEARKSVEALEYIPTGLPASRVLSMQEITGDAQTTQIEDGATTNSDGETVITGDVANQIISTKKPIVEFELQNGSLVMASANGTVIMVGEDAEYTRTVKVDHGNGYVSIYRCPLDAVVSEGDIVEKGDFLFEMSEKNVVLGYQMLLNAEFINPIDVMELKG